MFINDTFLNQLQNFDFVTNSGERSPLLATNFIKINNLLNLLSTSHPQPQSQTLDHSITTTNGKMIRIKSNESLANIPNNNDTEALINSLTVCCSQHSQTSPYVMYPVNRPASPQRNQFLSTGVRSRCNSNSNLLKTPSVLSRQSTVCYIHK